jgi:hypothetical protein
MVFRAGPVPSIHATYFKDGNPGRTFTIHSRNLFSGWHFAPGLCHPFAQLIFRMVFRAGSVPSIHATYFQDGNPGRTFTIHSHNLFSGWYFGPDLCHPFTQLIFRMAFCAGPVPSIHTTYFQDGNPGRTFTIHSHNLFSGWQSGPDFYHPFAQLILRMAIRAGPVPSIRTTYFQAGIPGRTFAIHSHNLFSGWYFGPDLYHPFTQLILRMAIRAGLLPSIHATYFQDGILRRACAIHSHNLFSGWYFGPDLCHPFAQLIFRMAIRAGSVPSIHATYFQDGIPTPVYAVSRKL